MCAAGEADAGVGHDFSLFVDDHVEVAHVKAMDIVVVQELELRGVEVERGGPIVHATPFPVAALPITGGE